MSITQYFLLYLSLALIVLVAYYISLWDVARLQRNAQKHSEYKHLIELLRK